MMLQGKDDITLSVLIQCFVYASIMAVTGASLVGQLLNNLLAMQETLVQFLGWEDPLEKG